MEGRRQKGKEGEREGGREGGRNVLHRLWKDLSIWSGIMCFDAKLVDT